MITNTFGGDPEDCVTKKKVVSAIIGRYSFSEGPQGWYHAQSFNKHFTSNV
jgi:hypothetical protein